MAPDRATSLRGHRAHSKIPAMHHSTLTTRNARLFIFDADADADSDDDDGNQETSGPGGPSFVPFTSLLVLTDLFVPLRIFSLSPSPPVFVIWQDLGLTTPRRLNLMD